MPAVKKRFLLDKNNKPAGVVLDIKTFQRIEELLEDRILGEILKQAAKETPMTLAEGQRQFARLRKNRDKKRR